MEEVPASSSIHKQLRLRIFTGSNIMEEVPVTSRLLNVAPLILAFCTVSAVWFLYAHAAQKLPRRWPLLGFLPSLIYNYSNFYEWITHLLILSGGTVTHLKGPWTNWIVTADSANVEYVLKTRFHNFVRGDYYREVFRDVFGDMAIFVQDGDTWRRLRTTVSAMFASPSTRNDVNETTFMLVYQRVLPLFRRAAREGIALDLEDVLHRYTFDSVSSFGLGFDPGSLTLDLTPNPFAEALDRSIQASMRRFLVPALYWKTLRFLNLGTERQIGKDRRVVHDYVAKICALKRQEMLAQNNSGVDGQPCRPSGVLPLFLQAENEMNGGVFSEEELRGTCVSIIMAGRDTTATALAWFFWILQQHPRIEQNILKELKGIINRRSQTSKDQNDPDPFSLDELKEMNYLQAALSESMRLYPSVPIEILEAANDDVLPDGTKVKKGSTVLCLFYSMARMESIWGKDCREFKPERWLEKGKFMTKSELIYPVFSEGPRRCLGREVANVQMKCVTSAILVRYSVKAVGGHSVVPTFGMMLGMNLGLKVSVHTR